MRLFAAADFDSRKILAAYTGYYTLYTVMTAVRALAAYSQSAYVKRYIVKITMIFSGGIL